MEILKEILPIILGDLSIEQREKASLNCSEIINECIETSNNFRKVGLGIYSITNLLKRQEDIIEKATLINSALLGGRKL